MSKRDLERKFDGVLDDLLSNYERYSENGQQEIRTILQNLIDLEERLNGNTSKIQKKIEKVKKAFNDFFGTDWQ